ncbi:Nicotinamide/nicotinic acid mononucleotide adenylyltransferase 1 [Mortierella hygrophila]|uniref:Nicotinamide-nucleotide adenylyltransferase n=1 Tax=Mortierella hygrophila TaxID=979708 RepID=A0A9P6JY87_9FUNG|nr:Nicotinamide/nicotinic acid mononucleotide adenylyltransferase 1 [Mortierella hygrophila]
MPPPMPVDDNIWNLNSSSDRQHTEAYGSTEIFDASNYTFPRQRIPHQMKDESKTPLVIVACGSFSPITYLHLRMFEMARDHVLENTDFEIMGGYFSPVSDFYQKQGLAEAKHRVRMCELAVDKSSTWLMVDSWESLQTSYQRTAIVLDHFQHELNGADGEGGVKLKNGEYKPIKIMLLAGGDLVQSFAAPDVWATADLHHIIGKYGCLILERTGSDVYEFLLSHDVLYKHRRNVFVIKQLIYNDISSTKIRLFIRRGMSIKYLLPTAVIDYIYEQRLYAD